MNRVIHFEMSADDPSRAANFYRSVFGWGINRVDIPEEYWTVDTGHEGIGINGAISMRNYMTAFLIVIQVSSLEYYMRKLEQHGGVLVGPRLAIPHFGNMAYCRDPFNNLFGVVETITAKTLPYIFLDTQGFRYRLVAGNLCTTRRQQ